MSQELQVIARLAEKAIRGETNPDHDDQLQELALLILQMEKKGS